MTISMVPALMDLAKQREAEQAEAEAWKVAQLAAMLCASQVNLDPGGATAAVKSAQSILRVARRQAAAPAGERDDG